MELREGIVLSIRGEFFKIVYVHNGNCRLVCLSDNRISDTFRLTALKNTLKNEEWMSLAPYYNTKLWKILNDNLLT